MSRVVRMLFAVALLASVASVASAVDKYPPGPSYRSCPDSVTMFQVQRADTIANPCYPAIADTVQGIRGIITGFRLRSTGRIYMQNSNGSPYNALQIYTVTHTESAPWNYAIGDSISVITGLSQAYQGESQIQGYMTGSPVTLITSKISSGNPLPPFHVGTTSEFKWSPAAGVGSAFAHCDPLEGALVRINGPLKVARVAAGAGLYSPTNWLLVNGNGTAPGDSILVDGYTLPITNIGAPALGETVEWVQGILRRATNGGVDCWMISLRDVNDKQDATAPNLSEAYPIADNKLRLVFDKNVDVPSAETASNYTLGSAIMESTVDDAEVVGGSGNVVDLTITDMLPRKSLESIMSENIYSATCVTPTCASPQQSLDFILGVLTCAEVQAPQPDSLLGEPCLDKSVFAGGGSAWSARMTVRGVYMQQYGSLRFMVDAAGVERGGIAAYNVPFGMTVGNQYLLACRVQEYYTLSELVNPAALIDEGPVAVPSPLLRTVAELANVGCDPNQDTSNAEDYEGVFVRVERVRVVPFNTDPVLPSLGGSFRVVALPALADTILISNLGGNFPTYQAVVGAQLNVQGMLHIDGSARILPRNIGDITPNTVSVTNPTLTKVNFAVGPSPARGVATKVNFSLPKQADVDLSVFDLSGRKVATLASGSMAAGPYVREWNGAGAGAGVYFVRLRVGSETYNLRTISLK